MNFELTEVTNRSDDNTWTGYSHAFYIVTRDLDFIFRE